MYAWLWRSLPFNVWGKLVGSLLILTSVVVLLWFVLFPIIEPIMPFNNVQMPGAATSSAPAPAPAAS